MSINDLGFTEGDSECWSFFWALTIRLSGASEIK